LDKDTLKEQIFKTLESILQWNQ